MRSRRRQRKWRRWLLGLLLAAGALELALRPFAGNFAITRMHEFHVADGRCVALKPDLNLVYTGWGKRIEPSPLDSNRYGFRGPAVAPGRNPSVYRVAVVGDSITYGQGVTWGEALPAALQAELAAVATKPIQVLNFGISALNFADYPEQITRFVARWAPDMLLLVVVENDAAASYCTQAADTHPFVLQQMPNWVTLRFAWIMGAMAAMLFDLAFNEEGFWTRREATMAGVAAIEAAAAAIGVPLRWVLLGDPIGLYVKPKPGDLTAAVMEANGTPWLDGRTWRFAEPPTLATIPWEGHLTPAGNREAARRIAAWLRPQLPLTDAAAALRP